MFTVYKQIRYFTFINDFVETVSIVKVVNLNMNWTKNYKTHTLTITVNNINEQTDGKFNES